MSLTENYISVVGVNLLDPIAAILDRLEEMDSRGPNEVQASVRENGYAVSLILLAVVMLESLLRRVQYIKWKRGEIPSKKERNILEFVESVYPDFLPSVQEMFVVRDVIAHGHIWEAEIIDDDDGLKLIKAAIIEGHGDKKLLGVMNSETRLTNVLCLNLFPTRINRQDALIVLSHICGFLRHIETRDHERRLLYISPQPLRFRHRVMMFEEFARLLPPAYPEWRFELGTGYVPE